MFPYAAIIERLGRGRSVFFVTVKAAMAGAPEQYRTLELEALDTLSWERTAAVVTHPCWVYEIAGRKPGVIIALLQNGEQDEAGCRDALCAAASVVVTASEPFYFEQWFRRGGVFVQDGLDTASDLLADAALSDAAAGKSVEPLAKLQLQRRVDFREEQLQALRPSPMQFFFQAVYCYLLGKGEDAERWALDAFHLAILGAEQDAVGTYFRFLSAIRLQQGRTDDAIATYGISIVDEEERMAYHEMAALQADGETQLAAALLYRMNDDYRRTTDVLTKLLDAAAKVDRNLPYTVRAAALLLEAHERSGRPGAALRLLAEPRTIKERLRRNLLEGRAYALEGRWHDAVCALLEAAMADFEPLKSIAELEGVRVTAKKLAEGVFV